jgi:hypothetical protein
MDDGSWASREAVALLNAAKVAEPTAKLARRLAREPRPGRARPAAYAHAGEGGNESTPPARAPRANP